MAYQIRKAVVIGSGTMGSGIAALLAGVGVDVLLLDIPARDTQAGDPAAKRNAVALDGLKRMQSARPAQLFSAGDLDRIRVGNVEDDLDGVADADWVIEVVVERLDIKRDLMAKLADRVGANTIVSTNTSGLPIRAVAEGLSDDFTRRFLGTHFFNPPRYLRLLEVIPHPNTDPAVVDFIVEYATKTLGKGVVIAKDEPNFIGNRFMTMSGMQIVNDALDNGFTVEEIDSLTGPLIGRPKTATFRLNDLVGIDIAVGVARNLYPAIPDDPARTVLEHEGSTALFDKLISQRLARQQERAGLLQDGQDGGRRQRVLLARPEHARLPAAEQAALRECRQASQSRADCRADQAAAERGRPRRQAAVATSRLFAGVCLAARAGDHRDAGQRR